MSEHNQFDPSRFRIAQAVPDSFKAEASGLISGLAASFGPTPDRQGDVIRRGAFRKSLADHQTSGTTVGLHWAHQLEAVVGRWTDIEETTAGLAVTGRLNLKTTQGRDAFEHVAAGDTLGLSIGFSTPENGRKYLGAGVFELSEIALWEISIVSSPADPRAKITGIKMLNSKSELVDALREIGLAKGAAVAVAAKGWTGLAGADDDTQHSDRLAEIIRTAARNLKGF